MTRPLKIGFKTIAGHGSEWEVILASWEVGDNLPVFDSAWLNDHLARVEASREENGGVHEGFVLASALAARTTRLEFGHSVLCASLRHPALIAKMAATLDHVSNGRFVLGLGAGKNPLEHEMFGLPFPPIGERITNLEATIQIVQGMWRSPPSTGYTFSGGAYSVVGARCDPPPRTPGGPRILLGTGGPRGIGFVGKYAHAWIGLASSAYKPDAPEEEFLETYKRGVQMVQESCEASSRDPNEIDMQVRVNTFYGENNSMSAGRMLPWPSVLQTAARFVEAGANHVVLSLPASLGPEGVSDLATNVAEPLKDRFA